MNRTAARCAGLWLACLAATGAPCHAEDDAVYRTIPGSEHLVTGMPAPRDQGELAYCYAAVPTTLLDRARCRKQGLDCEHLDDAQRFSMLHVAAHRFRGAQKLNEYGSINSVFHGLDQHRRNGGRRLASEACAPYASLARLDMPERPAHLHLRAGWDFLGRLHGNLEKAGRADCVDCLVRQVRASLPLKSAEHQLRQVLALDYGRRTLDFPGFVYRMVIPRECTADNAGIRLPDYRWKSWPLQDEAIRQEDIAAKIAELVARDIPVSLAYCSAWEVRDAGARCQNRGGHASIVVGLRRVCRGSDGPCWTLYKLQNSYGSAWAEKSHRLWVRAGPLLAAALELESRRGLLTWLE